MNIPSITAVKHTGLIQVQMDFPTVVDVKKSGSVGGICSDASIRTVLVSCYPHPTSRRMVSLDR